jgi:hypothetical protein
MVREGTIEEPAPSQRMSHEWVPFSFEFAPSLLVKRIFSN